MTVSRLTQKGQATIPSPIREFLHIRSGDVVAFRIEKGRVILDKAEPIDKSHLKSLQNTLSAEWSSEEDNKAYNDL